MCGIYEPLSLYFQYFGCLPHSLAPHVTIACAYNQSGNVPGEADKGAKSGIGRSVAAEGRATKSEGFSLPAATSVRRLDPRGATITDQFCVAFLGTCVSRVSSLARGSRSEYVADGSIQLATAAQTYPWARNAAEAASTGPCHRRFSSAALPKLYSLGRLMARGGFGLWLRFPGTVRLRALPGTIVKRLLVALKVPNWSTFLWSCCEIDFYFAF